MAHYMVQTAEEEQLEKRKISPEALLWATRQGYPWECDECEVPTATTQMYHCRFCKEKDLKTIHVGLCCYVRHFKRVHPEMINPTTNRPTVKIGSLKFCSISEYIEEDVKNLLQSLGDYTP